ncbi:MAG: hypothetical protein CMB67_04510 [Euryarchaeota archaeon]|nr:hypothetical protein [Euryarchaeota archaeon]
MLYSTLDKRYKGWTATFDEIVYNLRYNDNLHKAKLKMARVPNNGLSPESLKCDQVDFKNEMTLKNDRCFRSLFGALCSR